MSGENEIVFEDLHGVNDDEPVTIDLDASAKDDGIKLTPAEQAADTNAIDNDSVEFDGLRGADNAPLKDDNDDTASSAGADDKYSKKVKARILRANKATGMERSRADYWENQAKALAKESYEREKGDAESTIEQADTLIENTQDQLEAAIEAGNTKDQVRLTSQLTDQKAAKIQAEFSLNNLSPDGNVQPFSGKVDSTASTEESLVDKWKSDRSDWYGDKQFIRQTRLANRLDREVFADGFDPETDEYFEELDRRIKEKEPELFDSVDDNAGGDKDRGKPARLVAPVDSTGTSRRSKSSSKVDLGERDFAVMREFNLDPNDPEVLKEFARNKREAELNDSGDRS